MKIKNIMFSGAMASILMVGGAYAANDANTDLATAGFVRGAYKAAVAKTISNINTVDGNAIAIQKTGEGDNAALTITVDGSKFDAAGTAKGLVGELGKDAQGQDYANVKAYVDAKTQGIATDASLAELEERVTTNETSITNLTTTVNQHTTGIANNATEIQTVKKTAEQAKEIANGKQDALDGAQLAAVNSGITAGMVTTVTNHITNTDIHVTTEDKAAWNAKQDALTETQQAAVDSGITAELVAQIGTSASEADLSALEGRMDTAESEIDAIQADYLKAADKTELTGAINAKADKATTLAGYGITDAYTEDEVDTELAKKVDIDQGAANANQILITGTDGKVTTAGTITQAQVSGLSDALAAKQGTLQAKDGIDITGNEIKADVDGTSIKIDETTKKIKLGYDITGTTFTLAN